MKPFTWLVLAVLLPARIALAGDVLVNLDVDVSEEVTADRVGGTLTLEVMNVSGGDIRNVDLRPRPTGNMALAREVLQFGRLADGETGTIRERFQASASGLEATPASTWQLDYDAADGQHRRLIVNLEHQ